MENKLYLLNITVCGIKNIKEEVCLNFYKKTIDKTFNPEKYRVKAIYGENGSGKSAIITAVKIFQDLIFHDNYLGESKTQIFLDEIINKVQHTFCFSCEFLFDDAKTVYNYSIHIGKARNNLYEIQSEILQAKSSNYAGSHYQTIFEIKNGEMVDIHCAEEEKTALERKSLNLLTNHSFIHLYIINLDEHTLFEADNPSKELLFHLISFMIFLLQITIYLGEEDQHELYFLQKRLKGNGLGQQTLIDELLEQGNYQDLFASISEKHVKKEFFEKYKEKVNRLTQFIQIFKNDLVSIDIDTKENGEYYVCELNLNYGDYIINKEFESTGIKKLIRLFDCFVSASNGGIVFVDEMDSNLNDVYLCKLIEYFMYYGKGQLCFTTHNLDPMSILKKNRNSIDFLSSDNHLVSWTARGNATPENCYKNGMIEDSPFNIEASDFVGILGE